MQRASKFATRVAISQQFHNIEPYISTITDLHSDLQLVGV